MAASRNPRNTIVIDDDTPIVPPQSSHHQSRLAFFKSGDMLLRAGKTAELTNGDFLRIKSIWQDSQTTEVSLTGRLIRRTKKLGGFISPELNETCWMHDLILDTPSVGEEEVALGAVLRLRKLVFTNESYDSLNVSHTIKTSTSSAIVKAEGVLFCRYKFTSVYENLIHKKKTGQSNFSEKHITRLKPSETDEDPPQNPPPSPQRRSLSAETLIDDNEPHQYTFADAFCGAGGMSCAAQQAGLTIKWGLEHNLTAARTYQKNLPSAICEVASVEQFISFPPAEYHVDILHFSPPCQSFSPMQTRRGPDWEEKQVVILSIGELVKMVRPRIVTMEETFGLHFDRNVGFFATVVRILVQGGYEVRWKILNLRDYGAPQARKRLFLIAAGPQTPLPPFPPPTHLSHPPTITSLISSIPPHATLHTLPPPFAHPRAPYPSDGPLPHLIDTHGGGPDNYHPSGQRNFSLRELACLQTFPTEWEFVGGRVEVLRQIGNAVPPVAGRGVLEGVLGGLRRGDEERRRRGGGVD